MSPTPLPSSPEPNEPMRLTVTGVYEPTEVTGLMAARLGADSNDTDAIATLLGTLVDIETDISGADRSFTGQQLRAMYSSALNEIYWLRRALAYEAGAVEADLGYATYPKSRRAGALERIERMRRSARGEVETAYADRSDQIMRHALSEAGAPETLTNWRWETKNGYRDAEGRPTERGKHRFGRGDKRTS